MNTHQWLAVFGITTVMALNPWTDARAERPGLYLGGAWGAYSIDESALDDNDDLLRAFGGFQLTHFFAIEGSWTDFNRISNVSSRFEADGKGLVAVLSLPVGVNSALFAKAGQFWWDADSLLGGVLGDADGNDPFYGAGVKMGLNDHFSLRFEVERYDVSDVDLDTVSIGLQFKF